MTPNALLPPGSDLLLARDRLAVLAEILAARTAWAPDWLPAPGGAGHGLAEIHAGNLELLQQRLAQVPAHRQALLLDMVGASLLPAQGARTHVLLTAVPGTPGARVPAGTRIGAAVPGRDGPVVFETREPVAISPAALVEVHTVLPAADLEQDHSADVLAGRPVTLFGDPARVDRDLYVGHDELLAFDGRAVAELEVGIAVPAPRPIELTWSWWDGDRWREFAAAAPSALEAGDDDSVDGTAGLTRSGTVRLVAPCATSKPLQLEGRTTHWVRGRLTAPLNLPVTAPPPTISRLRLAVVNEHRRLGLQRHTVPGLSPSLRAWWPEHPAAEATLHLRDVTDGSAVGSSDLALQTTRALSPVGHQARAGVSPLGRRAPLAAPVGKSQPRPTPAAVWLQDSDDLTPPFLVEDGTTVELTVRRGLPLDKAIADQRAADLSKAFAPLGPSPVLGTAFVFACATATIRPQARVTLVVERPVTAAEEADGIGGEQKEAAEKAAELLATAKGILAGAGVDGALTSAKATLDDPIPALTHSDAGGWYTTVRQQVVASIASLKSAAGADNTVWDRVSDARSALGPVNSPVPNANPVRSTLDNAKPEVAQVLAGIAGALEVLVMNGAALRVARTLLQEALDAGDAAEVAARVPPLNAALTTLLASPQPWLPANALPPFLATDPDDFRDAVISRLQTARGQVEGAQAKVAEAFSTLEQINAEQLVTAIVPTATSRLEPPRVAWEYHDGRRWRALGMSGDPEVLALQASGSLHFTVPDDISDVDIDGDVRRWLRARLEQGSYSALRLISWTDTQGGINYLPVVEPRAPMVDRIEVFYTHRSESRDPGAVLAHDDHTWRDLTADVTWPGPGGTPFVPMAETAPTFYLGLDGELPADHVGLWLHPAAPDPWAVPQRPVWEGYDGREWVRLATEDGTDGLRRSGVVRLLWPGTSGAAGVTVSGALGRDVALLGRGAALRFAPGDRLVLADLQGQEPVVVAAVDGEKVTTRAPVSRPYANASLAPAPPARFGTPRTWLRASFDPTRPPPVLTLAELAVHAVAVDQVETLRDELLGSGDGGPGQVLVARRFPVAGDADLEVRELDGDRADLDAEVLLRTLSDDGVDPATVRAVHDPRSGRVTEVWVPWAATPSLVSAGPQDRVYVLDHAQGRFVFGGAGHGRPLPEGRDNVRLRAYRTCEGEVGNVGAGALTQLLSAVAVGSVTNPEPASGGAAVEPLAAALRRAPGLLRHRRLALTERDVEAIAVEASPAVVRARVVGARDRYGRPQAGAVRVVVVPRDGSDRPVPGPGLLAQVRDAVVAASPVVAVRRVTVEGPVYLPVGIDATVLPVDPQDAGPVRERVLRRLEELLHPLRGGPYGEGWDFGGSAHLSDVARVLEAVPGVDAISDLSLTSDGIPAGDAVRARADQVVCAGPIAVRLGRGV